MLLKKDSSINLIGVETKNFSILETLPKRKCGIKLSKEYYITEENLKYYVRKKYSNITFEFTYLNGSKLSFNSPYLIASLEISEENYKSLRNSHFFNKKEILSNLNNTFSAIDKEHLFYYNINHEEILTTNCSFIMLFTYLNNISGSDKSRSNDNSTLDKYPYFSDDKNSILEHCIKLNNDFIVKNNELISTYFSEISTKVSQYEKLAEKKSSSSLSEEELQKIKKESEAEISILKNKIDSCMHQISKRKKCIKKLQAEFN